MWLLVPNGSYTTGFCHCMILLFFTVWGLWTVNKLLIWFQIMHKLSLIKTRTFQLIKLNNSPPFLQMKEENECLLVTLAVTMNLVLDNCFYTNSWNFMKIYHILCMWPIYSLEKVIHVTYSFYHQDLWASFNLFNKMCDICLIVISVTVFWHWNYKCYVWYFSIPDRYMSSLWIQCWESPESGKIITHWLMS